MLSITRKSEGSVIWEIEREGAQIGTIDRDDQAGVFVVICRPLGIGCKGFDSLEAAKAAVEAADVESHKQALSDYYGSPTPLGVVDVFV